MRSFVKLEEGRNYNSIDLFKLIFAIAVVAAHTNPIVTWTNPVAINLVVMIEEWTVPFFYIASGFFLQNGMKGKNKEEQQARINKYMLKIIKMYCIWTLISFPLTIYGYVVSDNNIISCVLSYVKYFLFVGKLYNSYHLSYLLATIYALFLIKLLHKKNIDVKIIFLISAIIYVISEILSNAAGNLDNLHGIEYNVVYLFQYVFNNGGVFKGMIYLVIGIMISTYRYYFGKLTCLVGIVGLNIVEISMHEYVIHWITMAESMLVFMFCLGINLPNSKIWPKCREYSTRIYLSHLIFYSFYTFVIIHEPNKLGFDSFIVTVVLCLLYAALVSKLKQRIN